MHLEVDLDSYELVYIDQSLEIKRIDGDLDAVDSEYQDVTLGTLSFAKLEQTKNVLSSLLVWNPLILTTKTLLMIDTNNPHVIKELDIDSSMKS